jgi:hypothetical protein
MEKEKEKRKSMNKLTALKKNFVKEEKGGKGKKHGKGKRKGKKYE